MIFKTKPDNFAADFHVVACYCKYQDKFLFLLRSYNKLEGNKWGLPAGKVNEKESIGEALKREMFEETGIDLPIKNFNYLKKLYVKYPNQDFVYHIFKTQFNTKPRVKINPKEHTSYDWLTLKQLKERDLILDQDTINNMLLVSI